MRMVESGGARNWPSSKDSAMCGSQWKNMAAEELGLLLKGHRFHRDQTEMIPNRSGSAPPSMEGSFAAIGNLFAKQNSGLNIGLESISDDLGHYESEEQLRSDPAYFAYYCSNVNLNPRLPLPLISRENRRLVRHIGASGNNWRSTTLDDTGNRTLHMSRSSLSTHREEPEDDRSPTQASDNRAENSSVFMSGQKTGLVGRHKSLVDLIQEDFPRTPSPVYNQSRSSSHATTDEPIDRDVHAVTLDVSAINISDVPGSSSSADVCVDTSSLDSHDIALISKNDQLATSFSSSTGPDGAGSSQNSQIDDRNTKNAGLEDDMSVIVASHSERIRKKQEEQQYHGRVMLQQYPSEQQGTPYHVHSQTVSPGTNHIHNGMEKLSHGHTKFSSIEVQPSMHSPGLTTPLYATAGTYMPSGNPYYPNFQPSGIYAPHYNIGGYALNSAFLPSFVAGYPPHGPVPMPLDPTSGPSFNIRTTGVSTAESIPHMGDFQQQKFYGQHGMMVQPSFVNPVQMPYFQHPFGDAYSASVQQVRLPVSNGAGAQADSSIQKEPSSAAYMGDQKLLSPPNGSLGIPNSRKLGISVGGYYGGLPDMGLMAQFPVSPISSPVLPSSPVGGISHPGRRNDLRYPQGSHRNTSIYPGWQGQRGVNIFEDSKRHTFLEELKSSNAQKFELSDIAGRIVEFSVDQHGSRFIQQKLEHCSVEDKVSVFKEVLPHASKLMTDVFGNYVIQKFFEHGSPEQRKELADKLVGQMLPLSLQMYGCRVIQKALEVIELDQKTQLVLELDGHVMRCVRDQNGNHVIQKCIECVPTEKIGFIISAFRGQVATLSTHPYGCRVIQRVLEYCSDEQQGQCIVDEILESARILAQDQYGNYVTQHVLERGKSNERSQIISKLAGKIVQLSQHKYASNVVEKCLEYGDAAERELLIEEIIGQSEENDNLLIMMKDQFANYVVQKILQKCSDKQREALINQIKIHCQALKKYTYGKHIVARFEQLYSAESQALENSEG
ncbi:pumilio homolog 5 isoform X2 [Mangifera indica]|nr:pumilio homolog 5 isoform X2 [Mangifera indica]